MENKILIEYLKQKGFVKNSDTESDKYKDENRFTKFFHEFGEVVKNMPPKDKHSFIESLKNYGEYKKEECTTEVYVKNMVSKMSHIDINGLVYSGEYFSLEISKELCTRYSYMCKEPIVYTDLYIAINAQYHDYKCLFQKWFDNDVDSKIVESAIIFWFCDSDYKTPGSKLWNYFKHQ